MLLKVTLIQKKFNIFSSSLMSWFWMALAYRLVQWEPGFEASIWASCLLPSRGKSIACVNLWAWRYTTCTFECSFMRCFIRTGAKHWNIHDIHIEHDLCIFVPVLKRVFFFFFWGGGGRAQFLTLGTFLFYSFTLWCLASSFTLILQVCWKHIDHQIYR